MFTRSSKQSPNSTETTQQSNGTTGGSGKKPPDRDKRNTPGRGGRGRGRGRGKGRSQGNSTDNQTKLTAFRTPPKIDRNMEQVQSSKRKKKSDKKYNKGKGSNKDIPFVTQGSSPPTDENKAKKRDIKESPELLIMSNLIDEVQAETEKLQFNSFTLESNESKKMSESESSIISMTNNSNASNDSVMPKEEKEQEEMSEEDVYSNGSDGEDIIIGGEANETDEEIGATELIDSEEESPLTNNFKRLVKSPPKKSNHNVINGIPVTVLQDSKRLQRNNSDRKVQIKLFDANNSVEESSTKTDNNEFPLDHSANDHIVEYQEELEKKEKQQLGENKKSSTTVQIKIDTDTDNLSSTVERKSPKEQPEEIFNDTKDPPQCDTDNKNSMYDNQQKAQGQDDDQLHPPELILPQPEQPARNGTDNMGRTKKDNSSDNKHIDKVQSAGNASKAKKSGKNKPKKKKNKQQSKVNFLVQQHQQKYQKETQDDENTINSDKTSHHMKKKEADQQVPPSYVRYRIGIQLDKLDLKLLLENNKDDTPVSTPLSRYREVLLELITFIHSFDSDAKLISWKCNEKYTSESINPDKFPQALETFSTYFNGYRKKLNEAYRNYFKFCLHTPKWNNLWVETKLMEWAELHSFIISKCVIQAESAKSIGWILYSLSFTNLDAITKHMEAKSDFEWGLKLSAPANDTKKPWRDRLKAYDVFVPTSKVETAKAIISEVFASHQGEKLRRTLEDCYIFVGHQRRQKKDKLSKFHAQMVGRQSFRDKNINTFFVTCIVNEIDTRITTRNKEEWTLREMILNQKPKNREFGDDRLFLSIDFTNDSGRVWFNGVRGDGGPGYFLSAYTWNFPQAELVSHGLGAYLGRQYGKTGLHKYLSEDHWQTMRQWVWNKNEQEFDPPELRTTANNILHDPNAKVMNRWYDKQQKLLVEEQQKLNNTTDNNKEETSDENNLNVNSLETRDNDAEDTPLEQQEANIDNYIEQSFGARDLAKSIQSGYISISSSSSVSSTTNMSTFTQLKKQRAYEIMQAEKCEDLDSVNDPNIEEAGVKTIVQSQDEQSVSSSITGITNNTNTEKIFATEGVDLTDTSMKSATSSVSSHSLHSFKESDLEKLMDSEELTIDELEQRVKAATAQWKLRASQKAERYIALARQKVQQKQANNKSNVPENNDQNESPVKGKQKNSTNSSNSNLSQQSSSNCDAVKQK